MPDRKPLAPLFFLGVINWALRLDHRFSLSQRDVQAVLIECGITVSHEKKAAIDIKCAP
ncbi:hypothetical protein [Deinococcus humi]|uniref:Transposase-like protein n=1 Tax=Deinococcus humi TaxID=662880 RepID=A0A7W8JYC9_9DEIO|nr:hypothetical protein [Deinococcus humi]MBB5365230.1 transposase-like protein [Deinococcus humi]